MTMRSNTQAKRSLLCILALTTLLAGSCDSTVTPAGASEPNLLTYSRIDEAWALSDGRGATVAILDWQFDLRGHEAEKYVMPVSVVPGDEIGSLKPWHGEWMAEIVHVVAPGAKIIPIRTRRLSDRSYQPYVIAGIRYAADHGADVVTNSMGPLRQTDELRAAIDYAEQRGTLFVNVHPEIVSTNDRGATSCAAGECDTRIIHAGVVSVPDHPVRPSRNRDIHTWPYDLEANWDDGWGYSNAPPTVAGVVALMASVNPDLTPADIRRILVDTAVMKGGFKVLDAWSAASQAAASR